MICHIAVISAVSISAMWLWTVEGFFVVFFAETAVCCDQNHDVSSWLNQSSESKPKQQDGETGSSRMSRNPLQS